MQVPLFDELAMFSKHLLDARSRDHGVPIAAAQRKKESNDREGANCDRQKNQQTHASVDDTACGEMPSGLAIAIEAAARKPRIPPPDAAWEPTGPIASAIRLGDVLFVSERERKEKRRKEKSRRRRERKKPIKKRVLVER